MSSPTPIIIGSYCADFTITQPVNGDDYYYYKAVDQATNKVYYLANSRATDGNSAVDASDASTIRIISSPFVTPTNGKVTTTVTAAGSSDSIFREFRFRLVWDPAMTPDFTTTASVIPLNRRRYLTWMNSQNDSNDPTFTGTSGLVYNASKVDRFVEIETIDVVTRNVKFSGATTDGSTASTINTNMNKNTGITPTLSTTFIKTLKFTATSESPTIQTPATQLKYLIIKNDFDVLTTTAATSKKQLRYLVWNIGQFPTLPRNKFVLVDLYDPDVTTSNVQQCAFRFSQQTTFPIIANGVIPGGTTATGGSVSYIAGANISWGIDAYASTTTSVSLTTSDPRSYPNGFTFPTAAYKTLFPNGGDGFSYTYFSNQTDASLSASLQQNGFQNLVVNIQKSQLTYVDCTNGIQNGVEVQNTDTELTFVITNQLVDKTVEELFTNLNVTLLKAVRAPFSSGTLINNPSPEQYLGLENATPSSTATTETKVTGTTSDPSATNRPIDLIVREYYKFFNPVRATQFKFYDLGKGIEYLWQARWPAGSTDVYTYIGANGDTVTFYPTSSVTQNQRGWILEWDNGVTPPGIRLRWGGNDKYLSLVAGTMSGGSGDSNPNRVSPTLTTDKNAAALFNCVQCSSLDATGACLPITNTPYTGNINPPGRTAVSPITISGVSPIPVYGSFRIRNVTTGYLTFTLTQIAGGSVGGSPTASFSPGVAPPPFTVSSPLPVSPLPLGSSDEFTFNVTDGVMTTSSRSRKAVFIKSTSGGYLKYTSPGSQQLELIQSNRPSDADGFAWILVAVPGSPLAGQNRQFYLYSVIASTSSSPVSQSFPNNRYIQPNGTLGVTSSAARFLFEGTDLVLNLDSAIIQTTVF
jgi:hypothetical protein